MRRVGDGDGVFWKEMVRQGRLRRPRRDLFALHYLTTKTEGDLPITHLFQEVRDYWNRRPCVVEEDELRDFIVHSDVLKGVYREERDLRLAHFAYRLRALDTTTAYPLLLFLLGERGDTLGQQRSVLPEAAPASQAE